MKLSDFLKPISVLQKTNWGRSENAEVKGIAYHSKKVEPGTLFVALAGVKTDGKKYITEAIQRGAMAIVLEGSFAPDVSIPQILVPNAREALAQMSAFLFSNPSQNLKLFGVTGTNGKTTLTYLLESFFSSTPDCAGVIGTINTRYGQKIIPASHTTPESRDLQEILASMVKEKVTHVAIEVSSHALDQNRVTGLDFDAALFTNLTQDHLDYHASLEEYFKAKEKLFTLYLHQSSKKEKIAVINCDTDYGKRLWKDCENLSFTKWSYGFDKTHDIFPKKFSLSALGIEASLQTPKGELLIKSPLLGKFNLENIMAAVGVGLFFGLSREKIEKTFQNFSKVPGRLERVEDNAGRHIFVDYAHTPDALKNVLQTLGELKKKKIITVFGCGGDRDPTKRAPMGEIAASLSDISIVTSDNPRTEDPKKIIDQVLTGITKTKKTHFVEPDRKKAIEMAIRLSEKDDIVLVAGKGHEDYQIIGETKFHFSDQEIIKSSLPAESGRVRERVNAFNLK